MKRCSVLMLLLCSLFAKAQDSTVVVFDRPLSSLLYHLRLERLDNDANHAVLFWNYADSLNHKRAEFDIPPREHSSDYASPALLSVICRNKGCDSTLLNEKIFIKSDNGMSAILSLQRNGAASLSLGGDKAEDALSVPFDSERPGTLSFSTSKPTKTLNNFVLAFRRDSSEFYIGDLEQLIADSKTSTDRLAAIWTYLDRNTDPAQTAVSRRYVLATVPDGEGGYDIVYVDGDTPGWKPGRIKGHMRKTIFSDHFDLEWVTADGTTLRDDTSATIEGASNILRLDFPLLKSSVRFRRAK